MKETASVILLLLSLVLLASADSLRSVTAQEGEYKHLRGVLHNSHAQAPTELLPLPNPEELSSKLINKVNRRHLSSSSESIEGEESSSESIEGEESSSESIEGEESVSSEGEDENTVVRTAGFSTAQTSAVEEESSSSLSDGLSSESLSDSVSSEEEAEGSANEGTSPERTVGGLFNSAQGPDTDGVPCQRKRLNCLLNLNMSAIQSDQALLRVCTRLMNTMDRLNNKLVGISTTSRKYRRKQNKIDRVTNQMGDNCDGVTELGV